MDGGEELRWLSELAAIYKLRPLLPCAPQSRKSDVRPPWWVGWVPPPWSSQIFSIGSSCQGPLPAVGTGESWSIIVFALAVKILGNVMLNWCIVFSCRTGQPIKERAFNLYDLFIHLFNKDVKVTVTY